MRKYGKNFKIIAAIMGTKTENHLKSFYVHYRKRYSLDGILREYENDHSISPGVIEISDDEDDQVKLKKQVRCYSNCL